MCTGMPKYEGLRPFKLLPKVAHYVVCTSDSVHFIRSFYFFSGAYSIPCILLEDLSFTIVATVLVSANLLPA